MLWESNVLLCISLVYLCIPGIYSSENDTMTPKAAKRRRELFTGMSSEDYSESPESNQLDKVDNDAIQGLVDKFLNEGTVEEKVEKKVNKEAQALINSSGYWKMDGDLKPPGSITDEAMAAAWLSGYYPELQKVLHQVAVAGWNYFNSASPITKRYLEEAEEVARLFLKASSRQSRQFNLPSMKDKLKAQQIQMVTQEGMNALEQMDLDKYNRQLFKINDLYTATPMCEPGKQHQGPTCLLKFTDLPSELHGTRDAAKSAELWKAWRATAGPNLTIAYDKLVGVTNRAAHLNGFANAGAMWRSVFDVPGQNFDVMAQAESVFQQILPFYKQLHAYIRPRLVAIYKTKEVTKDGAIPVHLLKSLNGDSWAGHYDTTKPFSDAAADEAHIGNEMEEHFHSSNYTVSTMFTKVYRYMKYLGFPKLPRSFWTKSIFSRNWSKDMICNPPTAYDMVSGDDYRIKICAQLGEQDFANAHKMMAQLYSKYLAREQPILLRESTNPSLGTAISGAFSVLATNGEYLKAQNLLNVETERSEPMEINRLYKEALDEVVRMPFAMVADKWRYSVFEGNVNKGNWSEEWWRLREVYQGLRPPQFNQTNEADKVEGFDAVASPAIAQQHSPAIRNFVSYVLQFQVLKKICADNQGPLAQGCIPNKEAIKKIIDMMGKGGSVSWIDALEEITGSRNLDAKPLLEYYEPLIGWLSNANEHQQMIVGWEDAKGEPFADSELPELQHKEGGGNDGHFSAGEDQIAFPGASCIKGQECLLDSVCNGTVCVCKEGLFTLQIADTYNCVPGDPQTAGFSDNSGGLIIALNPSNETSNANVTTTNSDSDGMESDGPKAAMDKAVKTNRTNSARDSTLMLGLLFVTLVTSVLVNKIF